MANEILNDDERHVTAVLHRAFGDASPPADGWADLQSRMAAHRRRPSLRPRFFLLAAVLALTLFAGLFAGSRLFPGYVSPRPEGVNIDELSLDDVPSGPLRVTVEIVAEDPDVFGTWTEQEAQTYGWGFEEGLGYPAEWPFVWEGSLSLPRAEILDGLKQMAEVATVESLTARPVDQPVESSILVLRVRERVSE